MTDYEGKSPAFAKRRKICATREDDFGTGYRSLAAGEFVIVYCIENQDVLIPRVVHRRRDLEGLFGRRMGKPPPRQTKAVWRTFL